MSAMVALAEAHRSCVIVADVAANTAVDDDVVVAAAAGAAASG